MHKFSLSLLIVVSGMMSAGTPALAASDYYLKIGDVKGEATDRAAAGTLELASFSWGASNAAAAKAGGGGGVGKVSVQDLSVTESVEPRDAASGLPTGKRQHKPLGVTPPGLSTMSLVVTGPGNAVSEQLDRACASGKHIAKAELGARGQVFDLQDVEVTSCTATGTERRYEFRGHVTLIK